MGLMKDRATSYNITKKIKWTRTTKGLAAKNKIANRRRKDEKIFCFSSCLFIVSFFKY
jgi:hypothetical protein